MPPQENRLDPWPFGRELDKRRNEIERLFGRIERFRRVLTRYAKTDQMFRAFVTVAFIADQLRQANSNEVLTGFRPTATRRRAQLPSAP